MIGDGGKGRPEDGGLVHLEAHLEGLDGAGSECVPDGRQSPSECLSHARGRTLHLLQQIAQHEDLGLYLDPPVAVLLDGQDWELEKVCILEGPSLC